MIISSLSYKGGVGKTTIAQNLAVCLAHTGYKTCIVDADESQNSVMWTENRAEQEPAIAAYPNHNHRTITKTIQTLYEKEGYEAIIIDSPPALSPIASKIILSSHIVLIPVSVTGAQDVLTTERLLDHYETLKAQKGAPIRAFFVINNYDPHIKLHQAIVETVEELSKEYKVPILQSKLFRRTVYGEAPAQGLGVYECKNPKAKQEAINLTNEVLQISEKL